MRAFIEQRSHCVNKSFLPHTKNRKYLCFEQGFPFMWYGLFLHSGVGIFVVLCFKVHSKANNIA